MKFWPALLSHPRQPVQELQAEEAPASAGGWGGDQEAEPRDQWQLRLRGQLHRQQLQRGREKVDQEGVQGHEALLPCDEGGDGAELRASEVPRVPKVVPVSEPEDPEVHERHL